MKIIFAYVLGILKSIVILILAFIVLSLVNMLHDPLIHFFAENGFVNDIPATPMAQFISICIIFLAGLAAASVVSALSGNMRIVMSVILLVLFLIIDIQAAYGPLANTSLPYRLALVGLVPVEIWIGYVWGKRVHQQFKLATQSDLNL